MGGGVGAGGGGAGVEPVTDGAGVEPGVWAWAGSGDAAVVVNGGAGGSVSARKPALRGCIFR